MDKEKHIIKLNFSEEYAPRINKFLGKSNDDFEEDEIDLSQALEMNVQVLYARFPGVTISFDNEEDMTRFILTVL